MVRKIIFIMIAVLFLASCAKQVTKNTNSVEKSDVERLKIVLNTLNFENPTSDLIKNIKAGNNRFIGINGYVCFAPGVDENNYQLIKKYGINCLDGTSDAIQGLEHGNLINSASKYGKKYNKLLIRHLRGTVL